MSAKPSYSAAVSRKSRPMGRAPARRAEVANYVSQHFERWARERGHRDPLRLAVMAAVATAVAFVLVLVTVWALVVPRITAIERRLPPELPPIHVSRLR